jgi:hypothetical protein
MIERRDQTFGENLGMIQHLASYAKTPAFSASSTVAT